jgi:hypothetical protein
MVADRSDRQVSDLQETPAVPGQDPGGDDRLGLFIAGGTLIVLGWGLALGLNLALHLLAPGAGWVVGPSRISTHLGTFAYATAAFGTITGAVGVAMLIVARQYPRGPVVVPGVSY